MKTYEELRTICERNSLISARVIDDFLIAYAAGHRGMEKLMEKRFARYKHVGKKLGRKAIDMLKSQYLAHRVFRQEGLLERFMKHPALDIFTGEERDFLLQQLKVPWRFSFHVIVDQPDRDFYKIQDVFNGKEYLLFSPGMSTILNTTRPLLWFNLIGFNGFCWQSYGPVGYYQSFEPGDIWFFATELNSGLEDPVEIPAEVERDPIPFMMLRAGTTLPLTFHKEDQLLFLLAEHDLSGLDTAAMKASFKSEYDQGVYRLSLKRWGGHPHFAQAFFDEAEDLLLFSAMTDRGFVKLVETFNAIGHDYPAEPYLRVNMTMMSTASEILNKKIVLNEYLDLFQEEGDPEKDQILEDINAFIDMVLPDINAGRKPDIEEAARLTGVDPETARSVVESVTGSLDELPGTDQDYGKQKPASGKHKPAFGKQKPVSRELPPQPVEGVRLLSSDDELLLDLHLYMLADDLRRMAPWDFFPEEEFFGVQVPGTDLIYFIHVMGQQGEFPGLAFYKGWEGLWKYMDFLFEIDRISRTELSEEAVDLIHFRPWSLLAIPHMMLSFVDREELGRRDLEAIRKSGVRFRGNGHWPRIEEVAPAFAPVYPEQQRLKELYLVMQQAREVMDRMKEGDPSLDRAGDPPTTVLIRVPEGKGPRFRWKDHFLAMQPRWGKPSYSVEVSLESRLKLSGLPEADQELQIDMIFMPAPVKEKGSRPFFPVVLLLVDTFNGMVLSTSLLTPHPDLHALHESLPQKVVDELLKLGHRPSEIQIRSLALLELLKDILEEAGIEVVLVEEMPEMDEVMASFISEMPR